MIDACQRAKAEMSGKRTLSKDPQLKDLNRNKETKKQDIAASRIFQLTSVLLVGADTLELSAIEILFYLFER